ncbi:MAG TPA: hypothetical protein PLQ71_15895 [Nitrospira sp.]|nr:hypothetical protein [Nitrospira sp.]
MKVHRFKLSGGESITLNDAQLYALHHMPAQYVSWPTYWALRRRKLITGPQQLLFTTGGKSTSSGQCGCSKSVASS